MIEQLLKPIFKPIKKLVIRPLKKFKKLPKLLLKVIRKFLVTALFGPLRSLENYLRIGSYLIAKKLIAIIVVIGLLIAFFGFISPPKFVNKWFGRTPQIEAAAAEGSGFNGFAQVKNADGGLLYEGDLADGLYTGTGKLFYPNGQLRYRGDFDKGFMAGTGEYYDEEGTLLYRGAFAGDQYSGVGTQFYPDGSVQYEGAFAGGLFDGEGTEYNQDGSTIYSGFYSLGLYNGEGKLFGDNGKPQYEGQFKAGVIEGYGKLYNPDESLAFEGHFVASKKSGTGQELYPGGIVKYNGEYLQDVYQGAGTLNYENGQPHFVGNFSGGLLNGKGQAFNEAGIVVFDGQFANGNYEGLGTLFDADGAPIFKGFFREGLIYAEDFINLSLAKLQETLGEADPPLAADEEAPVEASGGEEGSASDGSEVTALSPNSGNGSSGDPTVTDSTYVGPDGEADGGDSGVIISTSLQQVYGSLQLSLELDPDPDNPEAYYVHKFVTWNGVTMAQIYQRLLDSKAASLTTQLDNGRTNVQYISGGTLVTFTMKQDKPVRLEITALEE
ncbi:hypothetical protein [Paenibacillus sp. HB172176]|uniref:hypothetical protein n=1 Tax=Paenibacillus sp. HB172176 TaxID=2493690 RepID=UPI00143CA945|nr:hypothetical protein [Paenibacillus sp. HB172176]